MERKKREEWERLRRQAGLERGIVYSTKDRSTLEQREGVDARDKDAIEFSEAEKKQRKKHSEYEMSVGRIAAKKGLEQL